MANGPQETILAAFNQASGGTGAGAPANANQVLTDALGQATQTIDAQTQATALNTSALGESSQAKGSNAGSAASDVLSTASQVLGGGLSLLPLVSLFSSLFGGGQTQQPAPLVPYSLPPSLSLQTTTGGQDVTWGENGSPRASGGSGSGAGQQITVQVQALDSQSFLDHSDDIAQAVRQAMQNMNSINDAITNL